VLLFGVINLFTYFLIQDCVTHKYNFLTDVDKAIPFMPEFVWIYHSLLPVIGVTMVLLVRSKKLFFNAMWACVATTLILHFFYVTFPSFYPRPLFMPQDLSEVLVQFSYEIDNSSNTFPSGHVAFAWIMFWIAKHSERSREAPVLIDFYKLWAIAISISTLAIKMHYVIDVIGGFIVASSCFFIVRELIKKYNWYAINRLDADAPE
tara:strand:- start:77 stop:694 length:618 start_codon:yes stop_codon:yes gene_type:complete